LVQGLKFFVRCPLEANLPLPECGCDEAGKPGSPDVLMGVADQWMAGREIIWAHPWREHLLCASVLPVWLGGKFQGLLLVRAPSARG